MDHAIPEIGTAADKISVSRSHYSIRIMSPDMHPERDLEHADRGLQTEILKILTTRGSQGS